MSLTTCSAPFNPYILKVTHNIICHTHSPCTGNSPPWKLPVKGAYLAKDGQRAARRVGKSHIKFPKDFLSMALTTSVERALLYIKAHYSTETFISATHYLMDKFWTPPHLNMTKDENLEIALKGATENVDGTGKKLFSDEDVKKIMAGREETKDLLKSETKRTADMGAFGLPWLRVTNDEGKTEPFFGSDRYAPTNPSLSRREFEADLTV